MRLYNFRKYFNINRYIIYLKQILFRYSLNRRLKLLKVSTAGGVCFYGMPIISKAVNSEIVIGENCVICSDSEMTALGVNHPVVLRTLRPGAEITIGDNTGISGGTICAAVSVVIGKDCLIGANVTITDTDFHSINPVGRRYNSDSLEIDAKPVIIDDNVFIGTGAIILKGVRIGKNSVIGAGAVVSKSICSDSIAVGNPAKTIRDI